MLQLKENVANKECFESSQDRLMHVISTSSDTATKYAFPIGQWFGVYLSWKETELKRILGGRGVTLDEVDLDLTTVGNYPPFRTGYMPTLDPDDYETCIMREDCVQNDKRLDPDEVINHIPVKPNEPLAFIYSDEQFIKGHSGIFNYKVVAYLATIVTEAQAKRIIAQDKEGDKAKADKALKLMKESREKKNFSEEKMLSSEAETDFMVWYESNKKEMKNNGIFQECLRDHKGEKEKLVTGDPFDFGQCFAHYLELFKP